MMRRLASLWLALLVVVAACSKPTAPQKYKTITDQGGGGSSNGNIGNNALTQVSTAGATAGAQVILAGVPVASATKIDDGHWSLVTGAGYYAGSYPTYCLTSLGAAQGPSFTVY